MGNKNTFVYDQKKSKLVAILMIHAQITNGLFFLATTFTSFLLFPMFCFPYSKTFTSFLLGILGPLSGKPISPSGTGSMLAT